MSKKEYFQNLLNTQNILHPTWISWDPMNKKYLKMGVKNKQWLEKAFVG